MYIFTNWSKFDFITMLSGKTFVQNKILNLSAISQDFNSLLRYF